MSAPAPATEVALVVMGVSGAGKSTIAEALAQSLSAVFVDADDLHSVSSRSKMASGVPLSDADRGPWLQRVGLRIAEERFHGGSVVVACSALRRAYRDLLRTRSGVPVLFVHLVGTPDLLSERLAQRSDHFMPPQLLRSQFETLEPLEADEDGIVIDVAQPPTDIVAAVVTVLQRAE